MKICKTCGKFILDDENGELAFTVNPGVPDKEYVECEICHDYAIDRNKIIQCEACGEWFSNDVLHSDEKEIGGDTFCACPSCGKDVVDCLTRAEFEEEHFVPKYAVVASFGGMTRGYQVSADSTIKAMEKLMKYLGESGMNGVSAVYISEILLDNDIVS